MPDKIQEVADTEHGWLGSKSGDQAEEFFRNIGKGAEGILGWYIDLLKPLSEGVNKLANKKPDRIKKLSDEFRDAIESQDAEKLKKLHSTMSTKELIEVTKIVTGGKDITDNDIMRVWGKLDTSEKKAGTNLPSTSETETPINTGRNLPTQNQAPPIPTQAEPLPRKTTMQETPSKEGFGYPMDENQRGIPEAENEATKSEDTLVYKYEPAVKGKERTKQEGLDKYQKALADLDLLKEWKDGVYQIDAYYGDDTRIAVEEFQRKRGLPVTGNLDQRTANELMGKRW